MNWRELFSRWDELMAKSKEELVDEVGEYWANTIESIKRDEEVKKHDK